MGLAAVVLIMMCGCWLTVRSGFVQFRRFGAAMKAFFPRRAKGKGGVGPFEAAATSLAATIGTGNITGVAGAILLAGPGTVFWMWVSAAVGMAIKYAEILFALRFRPGGGAGGPMECMERVTGRRFPGALYAFLALLAAFGMGNLVQARTISVSVAAVTGLDGAGAALLAGGVTAGLIGLTLRGGAKRVGRVSACLVPGMSAAYLLGAAVVLARFAHRIPGAFQAILEGAFTPRAALGGAAGYGFIRVMRVGVARGVFTHEAGLGTGALSHGAADTRDAQGQALYGISETFLDTIVMCTVTALVVLTAAPALAQGVMGDGNVLAIAAFGAGLGLGAAQSFVAAAMMLFAFSSMLAFALYAQRCARYLGGEGAARLCRWAFLACVILGAALDTARVWRIAEYCNACLALPNLMMLVLAEKKTGLMRAQRAGRAGAKR